MPEPRAADLETGEPRTVELRDVLAQSGLWSRREARRLRGSVETPQGVLPVDGRIALTADFTPLRYRRLAIDARWAAPPVVLLDKPTGTETSRSPTSGTPSVFTCIDDPWLSERVEPVGRLDRDTTGLLIFTADGRLNQRLAHPKYAVERTYVAEVSQPVPDLGLQALSAGEVVLRDGHRPRPTRVERLDALKFELTLIEGKYHEVRRIFAALGSEVVALRRVRYAGISVDDVGGRRWRRLDDDAVAAFARSHGIESAAPLLEVRLRDDGRSEG